MTNMLDSVIHQLSNGESQTTAQLLTKLPALSGNPHGDEMLRLLLRLNRQVHETQPGTWVLVEAERSPEQRIVASARQWLAAVPGGRAPINALIDRVFEETAYDRALVHSVIQRHFVIRGKIVNNQLKEQTP
ncbi:MAG: hypothetical protein JXA33_26005 [Anaerolineae bacterium]|nr:hypothetical protein [Anaerolineae bacterium]